MFNGAKIIAGSHDSSAELNTRKVTMLLCGVSDGGVVVGVMQL